MFFRQPKKSNLDYSPHVTKIFCAIDQLSIDYLPILVLGFKLFNEYHDTVSRLEIGFSKQPERKYLIGLIDLLDKLNITSAVSFYTGKSNSKADVYIDINNFAKSDITPEVISEYIYQSINSRFDKSISPNKSKKILFVISRYGGDIHGGAEWHCRQIAEKLTSVYEVHVATTKALDYNTWENYYEQDTEELNQVKIFKFKIDQPKSKEIPFTSISMDRDKINPEIALKFVKEQGPYSKALNNFVIENQNEYQKIILFQYLYAPTFFAVRNLPASKVILVPLAHEERDSYLRVYRQIFSKPGYIVYNAQSERKLINNVHHNLNNKSDVVGVGVEILEDYKNTEFRNKFNIRGEYIVFVGRLEVAKRVDVLVSDFLEFKKRYPASKLQLVLVGKEVTPIMDHPDIIKTGFVSEAEKFAIMSEAVTLINPSPFESLSLIVLEAFLVKRPVMVNGYCDVLVDHCLKSNGGLWYESLEEFINQLNYLIENKDVAAEMGENGYKYVSQVYSWKNVMNKWLKILES
jgi:glycosyltransferase involved in cell wall biosynthesis